MRYLYTIIKMLQCYRCLGRKKRSRLTHVTDLKDNFLHQRQVKCLVLDFDGVLNAHGEPKILPECEAWLKELTQTWPEKNIVILSNKPTEQRLQYFNTHFPQISFCSNVRKKPYPDGLLKIAKQQNILPSELLLVDDRLLTGMLACCLSGSHGLLIKKPYKKFSKRPITEMFFMSLRTMERFFII